MIAQPAISLRRTERAVEVLLVLVAVLVVVALALRAQGMAAFTELSDSMAPAIRTGDLVVDRDVPAPTVRPGQVVSLRDPLAGQLITHRVVSASRRGDRVVLVTRGDANRGTERWEVPASADVRRMQSRVPHAGAVVAFVGSGPLRLLLLLGGAVLLGWAAIAAVTARVRR